MATKKNTTDETALAKLEATSLAAAADMEAVFNDFIESGDVSIVGVVKLGEPGPGRQDMYIGELIGPGEPIEMRPDPKTGEIRYLPTWTFHPLVKDDAGNMGVAKNVTHVIPACHQVNADCARAVKRAASENATAVLAFRYFGKVETRAGFRVNDIKCFEKYVPKAAAGNA